MAVSFTLVVTRAVEQAAPDPWELPRVAGYTTITERARSLRLPEGTKLLGVFDWDRDGRPEIFAGRTVPLAGKNNEFENHLLVLTEGPGGSTLVQGEYLIRDTELQQIAFFTPPDTRDTVKLIADVLGGSYWSTGYLVESGLDQPMKLFEGATDGEFVDLNGDGVYEAIAWNRRPDDQRCRFGMFGVRVKPSLFVRDGQHYRSVSPARPGAWREVMSQLADLDHDGRPEIVALEDNSEYRAGAQRLAVYKMTGDGFRMLAESAAPWPDIAVWLSVKNDGRLELGMTTPERCHTGEAPETMALDYELRDGALRRSTSR